MREFVLRALTGVALAAGACGGADAAGPGEGADLVLIGGAVVTLDPAEPRATAVAVRGERIVAVGGDREVLDWAGPGTRVIRLRGRGVTPGLVDAHANLVELGAALEGVALEGAASEAEAVRRTAAAAAGLPAGQWLIGHGWDETRWPERRLPSAAALDRAVGARPVLLYRADRQAAWASTAALTAAGLERGREVDGGRVLRGADGRPNGVVLDGAVALVEGAIPPVGAEVIQRRLLAGARVALAAGVTAVHEMGIDDRTADVFRNLDDQGRLPLRVHAFLRGDPAMAEGLARRVAEVDRAGGERFVLRGVLFTADGSLATRGARLLEPYADDAKATGQWRTAPGELTRAIEAAVESGWQVAVQAEGDAAVRLALDGIEAAIRATPGRDLRARLEGASVVSGADLARLGRHVIASLQPGRVARDAPWVAARLGAARIASPGVAGALLAQDRRVVLGSGAPAGEIGPLRALREIHGGVTSQPAPPAQGAQASRPAQAQGAQASQDALDLERALAAVTVAAAHAAFAEDHRGRLRPGMIADLTVLDRPLASTTLAQTRVDLTIVGGQIEFARVAAERRTLRPPAVARQPDVPDATARSRATP